MHPALGTDILAKEQHLRVQIQFRFQSAADGGQHVGAGRFRGWTVAALRKNEPFHRQPAHQRQIGTAVGQHFGEAVAHDRRRIGIGALQGVFRCPAHLDFACFGQCVPFRRAHQRRHQVIA